MSPKPKFFGQPQGAAILKHGILRKYLPVFANKTGSFAGQVIYLDCFAGPGSYDDQSDGSPALALQTAEMLAGFQGKASLHAHLIERDSDCVKSLRKFLEERGSDWEVHDGLADQYVPGILDSLDKSTPLFAFIDPFGLPIPFDMVVRIMKRGGSRSTGMTRSGAATEVLMNFSTSGINRVGGQLTAGGSNPTWLKARDTMVLSMDKAMGGTWWHKLWASGDPDRVDQIRNEYKERLCRAAGGEWAYFDINVSDRWQGPPAYHLLLFTQHVDGVWNFHQSLSTAREEFRTYCHAQEGIFDLEPLKQRQEQWIEHIEQNVDRLLAIGPFQPVHKIEAVFGDAFGEAREMHLRKALKNLKAKGKLSTEPKGPLYLLTLKR